MIVVAAETSSGQDINRQIRQNNAEFIAGLTALYKLHLVEKGISLDRVGELVKPSRLLTEEELKQLIR